ncbi:MAG: protoheme IX farnesyltransferase [Chloroflexi bacterium]|nr:protoheme IX farnesyltransferase [Chloroflexota bacterium]
MERGLSVKAVRASASIAWPRDYLSLAKPRIVILLVAVALVASIVAGAGDIMVNRVMLLALAGGMACAGASVLNNYLERDIDALMPRTRHRPLPSGRIGKNAALAMGLFLVVAALAVAMPLGYLVVLSLALGALVYVVVYTMWLKRRTPLNIVIGGLSGSFTVLAGWFAATDILSATPFLLALIIFLWTPSHFWSFALVHRESYKAASIPMLPLVVGDKATAGYIALHSALLHGAALLPYFLGPFGMVYLLGAAHLSGLFLISSLRLWRRPEKELAWKTYKFSGIYLLGLFLFMAADVTVSRFMGG